MIRERLRQYAEVLAHVHCDPWAGERETITQLLNARERKATLFFAGNGGSAAIASHFATDFLKAGRLSSLTFNDPACLTAFSNDCGYESVFSEPLSLMGSPGDILFAISSSGRSLSILNAVKEAQALQMTAVTLSGFRADNPLRQMGDINFYVPYNEYGLVEMAHFSILHSILDEIV